MADIDVDPAPPLAALTEERLAQFDAVARVSVTFDAAMLDPASGGALAASIQALIERIKDTPLDRLAARTRWRHRLLGADLEAKVQFMVAQKLSNDAFFRAKAAAVQTRTLLSKLEHLSPALAGDQARLQKVAAKAHAMLDNAGASCEPALLERFRRRQANLTAVITANGLAIVQLEKAVTHLRSVLDRFAEAESTLYPVWERHALALAQDRVHDQSVGAVREAARALIDRLLDADDR